MKKIMNHLLAGVLSLAAVFTTLPASQVQAAEKQYWTDAQEKAGYVEKVMNDGSIGSTFHGAHALYRLAEIRSLFLRIRERLRAVCEIRYSH